MKGVDAESLRGFLDGLRPQLEWARRVESELDRRMARRFNVLDYISTSELGLSRVIADLLNPKAAHGQGTLFLDVLLRGLKQSSERGDRPLDLTEDYGDWEVKDQPVRVETERTISGGRRLDVWVEVGVGKDRRCLAIENKPYAGDGVRQVGDYLDYLEKEYRSDRAAAHCLIYLPGSGRMPAERSVDNERLDKEKRERDFAVMPYYRAAPSSDAESEDDDDASFLLDYTLANWFRDCRRACDVDRLRWFLGDAESFCSLRKFGGNVMTDATDDQIDEVLMQRLDVVGAVVQRWPHVRAEVIKQFGDRLKARIEKELGSDVRCEHTLSDSTLRRSCTGIQCYRTSWKLEGQLVAIRAEAYRAEAMSWDMGVKIHALNDAGRRGQAEIHEALQSPLADALDALGTGSIDDGWPWWDSVADPWNEWGDDVVLELAREGGDAEEYFVRRFCEIFKAAKDSIDKAIA